MSTGTGSIQQFLLIYGRRRDKLLSRESFGDNAVAATIAYRAAEIECQGHPEMDIVLVGAESLETIKVTHNTYFIGSAARLPDETRAGVG